MLQRFVMWTWAISSSYLRSDRRRNAKYPAYAFRSLSLESCVTRHWRVGLSFRIEPDVVTTPVMIEEATVGSKVPFELPPVHTFTVASFLISLRLDAASAARASRAFSNASLTVSASVTSCGSSGEVTM